MPFASERQRRFMHAKHPEIAKRWEHEGGSSLRDLARNPNRRTRKRRRARR
jgi:hypothetical protein